MRRVADAVVLALLGLAAPATAAPRLVQIGVFDQPVAAVSPPNDLRVFVVEQPGVIRVVDAAGTIAAAPFLDITADVLDGGERGLLNLAFAPDYATTGRFYVYLTAAGGEVQVREYRRSAADPNRADPATSRIVLRQAHPASNHNGGGMAIGPDGRLWIGLGDGGGADNSAVPGSAQDPASQLGKLLRMDLTGTPQIFHSGLRNPWRLSFDRQTGDLVIADVGQNEREEIDLARAAAPDGWLPGANWGWACWEGTRRNTAAKPAPCDPPDDRFPVHELSHSTQGAVSITGGVVVRDPGLPTLNGRYLYGDYGMTRLRSLTLPAPGTATATDDRSESTLAVPSVSSIDEDACGRVIAVSLEGAVSRVVDGTPSPCVPSTGGDGGGTPGGGTPGGGSPYTTPGSPGCGLTTGAPKRRLRRTLERLGLPVRLRVRAACRIRLSATLSRAGRLRSRTVTLTAGERRVVRLRLTAAARRAVRRRLALGRGVVATITARERPAAGAERVRRVRVRIVR
jgi:glucose/arabinose dehydrogenase